jgi:hypothetical protein
MERTALGFATALGLSGCFMGPMNPEPSGSVAPGASSDSPEAMAYRFRRPDRMLELGQLARGDTRSPDGRSSSTCMASGRVGQMQDHLYGFEVGRTASYRFELAPQFVGVVQVKEKDKKNPWYNGIGCAAAKKGSKAVLSLPLNPGLYWVVVDGYEFDQSGPYTLRVDVDRSDAADLRPEQASIVEPLCKDAPVFRLGERAEGIFLSTPGGARAACGNIGGNAVRRLSLAAPARVKIVAAAHFTPAIEIRKACQGAAVACARAPRGKNEIEIVQDLEAGDYFVVLDATEIAPRDPYGNSRKGAGVAGAYILDAEEVRR